MKTVTACGIWHFNWRAPLYVDIEHQALALRVCLLQNATVGAVIVAEDLRPFQKFAAGDHRFKFGPGNEVIILALAFCAARLSRRVGYGKHQPWNIGHQAANQRGFAGA